MTQRKRALQFARQYRTCPPVAVIQDASQQTAWLDHCRICPWCGPEAAAGRADWRDLINAVKPFFPPPPLPSAPSPPSPGEFRRIHPRLGQWKDLFYFNPPLVLVLDAPSDDLTVTVAQVFPDTALAAPGDLILSEDQTGLGDLFAETWNRYPVFPDHLSSAIGRTVPEAVPVIAEMARETDAVPRWSRLPRPWITETPAPMADDGLKSLMEADPRRAFRRMEKKVAHVFSALEMTRRRLTDFSPRASFMFSPQSVTECLAGFRFPDEYYARAAAVEDEEWIFANLFILRKGNLEHLYPVHAYIHTRSSDGEQMTFFGYIPEVPDDAAHCRIIACISAEDGTLMKSMQTDWDPEHRRFLLKFPAIIQNGEMLSLALICEKDADGSC